MAAGSASSIYLRANPDSIIADGKSVTTITAEIRDSSGSLVPDGTQVSFSSSLGNIPTVATTTAGVARVRLTSDTTTGTAQVSAWVTEGGAVAQTKVELLAPGTEIPRQSFISIASKSYLVYDPALMVVYASGGVTISHRGLSIDAEEAQFDLKMGAIKCRRGSNGEPITLTRGGKSLQVMLFCYQTRDMKGKAVTEGESGKIEHINIRGADLAVEPDVEDTPQSVYDFVDLSESTALVKASSMTVRPGKDIHFRRAQIYVEGQRMISVPLHVMNFDDSQSQTSRYVGWGVNGLRVDLPFYYSLSPNSTGSLHLLRGQSGGWGFYSNAGWSLDLVEDYTTASGGQGTFALNRMLWSDWGAHWNHSQEFDSGDRIYSYLEFPAHKDVFGSMNYSKQLSKASLGLNVYGNKYQNNPGSVSTDLFLQSIPKPIAGGNVNLAILSRLSYLSGKDLVGEGWGTGLQLQLYSRPFALSKQSGVNSSLSLGHDWGGTSSGFTVLGNTSYNYRLGQSGNFGLIYSYIQGPNYPSLYGKHRLSANFIYSPSQRWRAHLFSTYMLDADSSSTRADVSYRITPSWRLSVYQQFQSSTYQTLNGVVSNNFSDTEIALGRRIREHEVSLLWSKFEHRFQLGFDAARF
jgi:hypothetical protein